MMENFADPIDRASAEQDQRLEEQLRAALAKKQESVLPLIGKCHNCEEPQPGRQFCDIDCRNDYEIRLRSRKARGF